jgi:hypothetical protein
MAAKCSEVCGWGQDSFPAMRREGSVRTVQHGGHENVVTWTVHKRDVTDESHFAVASDSLAAKALLLAGFSGLVAARPWTVGLITLEDLFFALSPKTSDNTPYKE